MNGREGSAKIIPWGLSWNPLDFDKLISVATRRTGGKDFSEEEWQLPLRCLIRACNEEAGLSLVGQMAVRQHLLELLETRFRLLEYWRQRPQIEEQALLPQLFITGLPKTGSTFLHRLLALDPANRVPLMWEVMFPLPSPRRESYNADPRIRRAEHRLRWLRWMHPDLVKAHPVAPLIPHECGAILSYSFESNAFLDMLSLPSYEAWLRSRDLTRTFQFHAQFLKHLQWHCPAKRWVLKSSDHLHVLNTLLKVYPDARLVFLHRDPLRVLKAASSQMALLKRVFSNRVNLEQLGSYESRCLLEKIELIMEFHDNHPQLAEHIIDIRYRDLADDPVGTVEKIYERFGLHLSGEARLRMEAFAAAERNRNGSDRFSLADFNLIPGPQSPRLDQYCERFHVEKENL